MEPYYPPATPGRLSNEDFKKLMQTPRRPDETPSVQSVFKKHRTAAVNAKRADAAADVFVKPKPAPKQQYQPKLDGGYRDRAAERRYGVNPDYANEQSLLREAGIPQAPVVQDTPASAMMTPGTGSRPGQMPTFTPVQGGAKGGEAGRQPRLSEAEKDAAAGLLPDHESQLRNKQIRDTIEKSKYLGGDVTHTHLVRGLDYALLQKVREEVQKEEEKKKDVEDRHRREIEERKRREQTAGKQFLSVMGKNIHNLLFGVRRQTIDTFLPGRATIVFDFNEDASEIPTLRMKPRHELIQRDLEERYNAAFNDSAVLAEIAAIVENRRKGVYSNAKERRKREQELEQRRIEAERKAKQAKRVETKPKSPPREALDPIFPDAVEELEAPEEATPAPAFKSLHRDGRITFNDLAAEREKEQQALEEVAQKLHAQASAFQKHGDGPRKSKPGDEEQIDAEPLEKTDEELQAQELSEEQIQKLRELARSRSADLDAPSKPRKRAAEEDVYMECYPGTFEAMGSADPLEDDEPKRLAKKPRPDGEKGEKGEKEHKEHRRSKKKKKQTHSDSD